MPALRDAIRYPAKRVLLPKTRLAYVHLRNLLTDAKRDRSARVSGYVAVWLPEELLLLFMEEGEVVNATASRDGRCFAALAISEAIDRVPTAAELGSVCFHEATNEQLDLMYATQTGADLPWPRELDTSDPASVLAYLDATVHDGAIEVIAGAAVNYCVLEGGRPQRSYFVESHAGDAGAQLRRLLEGLAPSAPPTLRLWPTPAALPAQASPALIQAYRDLIAALGASLREGGKASAAEVTEGARRALVERHPLLDRFSPTLPSVKDPVTDAQALTAAIAAWTSDVLWAACPDSRTPEQLLQELTASRRHVFQAAGFFDALPWKVQW